MVCQPMAMTPVTAPGRMSRQGTVWTLRSLCAAVTHSSSFSLLTSIRHSAVQAADRHTHACTGSSKNSTAVRTTVPANPATSTEWNRRRMTPRPHRASTPPRSTEDRMAARATIPPAKHMALEQQTPTSNAAVRNTGTRERRRLSKSFHRSSMGSGLASVSPVAVLTVWNSHGDACQSPRTQRWSRL